MESPFLPAFAGQVSSSSSSTIQISSFHDPIPLVITGLFYISEQQAQQTHNNAPFRRDRSSQGLCPVTRSSAFSPFLFLLYRISLSKKTPCSLRGSSVLHQLEDCLPAEPYLPGMIHFTAAPTAVTPGNRRAQETRLPCTASSGTHCLPIVRLCYIIAMVQDSTARTFHAESMAALFGQKRDRWHKPPVSIGYAFVFS